MKKLEFETSKGEFVVVDLPTEVKTVQDSFCDAILTTHYDGYIETYYPYEDNQAEELKLICKLSGATEEDANGFVDAEYVDFINKYLYRDYNSKNAKEVFSDNITAIESLHSLIESKGVHLFENPYTKQLDENYSKANRVAWEKEEEKTFYNPYLFKRIYTEIEFKCLTKVEDTKGPKYIIQGPIVTFYLKCGTPYSMCTYKSPITNKVHGTLLGGKFSNVDVKGDTTRSCVAMMKVRLYQLTLKFNRR